MNSLVNLAIESVNKSINSFCKFISANDAGATGAHQAGFYIPKSSAKLIFEKPGVKGENKERYVIIKWQNDFETTSRFIYYGKKTRNEYRLTRLGNKFPYLTEQNVGDLLILSQIENDYYEGFVLQSDDDIESFFARFNISSSETNKLINKQSEISAENKLIECFKNYIRSLQVGFPTTYEMAMNARSCYLSSFNVKIGQILEKPDQELIKWIDAEYQLFKAIENDRYGSRISTPFLSVEELIEFSNSILNRRKSRAGKSLEHHLSEMFNCFKLNFATQVVTEDNKRPDFIFPNSESYHNTKFPSDKLILLASKTTCKDRWRQILNEADRIKVKHLFTLQQGISSNQLAEMYNSNVRLVVPKPYLSSFPNNFRDKIITLDHFLNFAKSLQS